MTPPLFWLVLPEGQDAEYLVECSIQAYEYDFDGVCYPCTTGSAECLTLLTSIACRTNLEVAPVLTPSSEYPVSVMASAISTLDHLSIGRVRLFLKMSYEEALKLAEQLVKEWEKFKPYQVPHPALYLWTSEVPREISRFRGVILEDLEESRKVENAELGVFVVFKWAKEDYKAVAYRVRRLVDAGVRHIVFKTDPPWRTLDTMPDYGKIIKYIL